MLLKNWTCMPIKADVKALFEMAESKLKRMLTYNDLSAVFSLYHWLGLKNGRNRPSFGLLC